MAFSEVYEIEEKMHKLEDEMKVLKGEELERSLKQYSRLVQSYEVKGGYNTEEKLAKICTGLKFTQNFLDKEFNLLSGGEKTTVILGKLLMDNPDILLLDEPTNHLDMDSIEWLERYLNNYDGIVIIVSHDRYFLDNVVSKIIEIEDMESKTYKGNYSSYVKQKEEKLLEQMHNYKEQQKEIKSMESTIKDLRDWAIRADNSKFFKRAASMEKRLERMKSNEDAQKPKIENKTMKLNFKNSERSGEETIKAKGLCKSYIDRVIFNEADLLINFKERVALVGPNGSGKTTFLKMLLGEEAPDKGTVELGANVKVGYLPQVITFDNEEYTVIQAFRDDISILEGQAREYLSKFMFFGNSVFKKVKALSGGERIRLKLSMLLYEDINLLILDEPTNHLDIDSIETLEEALEEFKGTIFFISHDRYFINKIGERIIAIEDNKLKSYLGNYDYYKEIQDRVKLEKEINDLQKEKVIKKEKKKKEIDEVKKRENEIKKLEIKIQRLEKELEGIELTMSNLELNYEELNELFSKKEELSEELEKVMEEWIELNS